MHLTIFSLLLSLFVNGQGHTIHVPIGLNETFQFDAFDQDPGLLSFLNGIDTTQLGTTTYAYMKEDVETTIEVTISNEHTLVSTLVGNDLFISGFSFLENQAWLELFNPTLSTLPLKDYALTFNDTIYEFSPSATFAPLTALRIPLEQGLAEEGFISENDPLVYWEMGDRIHLVKKIDSWALIEPVLLTDIMPTAFRDLPLFTSQFMRHPKTIGPEFTINPNSWLGFTVTEPLAAFQLAEPSVTSLVQAKAWAIDVMYGRGMFAAGRVEEAFRTIEAEYEWMHPTSQALIFSQPNTSITGLNENGRQDMSTFREAVGRYNYLAARVPGATGLTMPPQTNFPWLDVLSLSGVIVGIFGVLILIKASKRKA